MIKGFHFDIQAAIGFNLKTKRTTQEHSVIPNLLNPEFKQGIPGEILLTDIIYIR